jgi:signal transduction histidine kinase
MSSKNLYHQCTKKNAFLLMVCCSFLFITACNENKPSQFDDRSPQVDSILEKASHFGRDSALQAIAYVDSALAGKKLTVPEKVKYLGSKCQVYLFYVNDTANAAIYADSMIAFAEANNPERYPTQYAYAFYSKGDVLFRKARYSDAYTYYYKARLIAKTSFNSCTMGEYTYRIAMILYKQARYKEAAENFQRGFTETGTCVMDFGKYFRMQEELNNIALCFYKAGNNDSSLHYYDKAIAFIDEHKHKFDFRKAWHEIAKGVIYGNKGQIFKEQGRFDEAEKLFRQNIAINLFGEQDISDGQLSYLKLADQFYIQGRIDSMGNALSFIRKSLDKNANKQAETEWSRLMWKYHDSKNETANAYKYLMHFVQLNDSTQKANKSLNKIDAGEQVRMLEKQHDIDLLTKENAVKQLYLVVVISVASLFILIGLLILYYWRQSRRNVRQLTVLNDQISNQKLQLEATLVALEDKNNEKDRILKVVAHDLRTPVASISMLADLILVEEDPVSRKEMVQLARQACNNSLALIAEILEVATVSSSSFIKEKASVSSLITECTDLLKLKASEKKQELIVTLDQSDAVIEVNKEKIKRVINNLIVNAVKFSEQGLSIHIKSTVKNDTVRISIKDQGIGIPSKMKSKVFDIFTDARREGTSGEKPFGLGLSICRQIMEAHNGSIWFESEEGIGTTFYLELKTV